MVAITFPTSSSPGERPQESGGRLVNAFVEQMPNGAPGPALWKRSPGLVYLFSAEGPIGHYLHTRGFLDLGPRISTGEAQTVYWALNDRLFTIDLIPDPDHLEDIILVCNDNGELLGHKPITMARNNGFVSSDPDPFINMPQALACTENGLFILKTYEAPIAHDLPGFDDILPLGTLTSVCDLDGYFVLSYTSGHIFASQLNSLTFSTLSFNTEQGNVLRRVARHAGRLYAFGNKWTTVYRNAGTAPFPFAREVTIPRGIVGTHAVAGWEAGWAAELIWVGDDFNVYKLNGYTPTAISNNDVSRDVRMAVFAGKRDLIEAFVYMHNKNAFWVLSCHDEWTWEYNVATGQWNERKSYQMEYWRGMKSVWAYDKWLVGDHDNGDLYYVSDTCTEGIHPLVWQVDSGVVAGFPARMVIPRASFNITTAVGSYPGGARPVVYISWSLDGGYSWGLPVERHLGDPGQTPFIPFVISSGLSRGQGVRYRLQVSDPVHVGLSGGEVEPQPRAP